MTANAAAVHFASRHIPIWQRYTGDVIGRVVRVGLGDSNQIHSGHGYDYGEQQGLINEGVPLFSTHLDSIANNGGAGSGTGLDTIFSATASDSYALAPAAVQPYLVNPAGFLKYPMLWNADQNNSSAKGLGCSQLPGEEALNGHIWYVQDPGMGASWEFKFRRNSSPYTTYGAKALVQNAGATSVQRATLELAADGARSGLALGLLAYTLSSSAPKGPMAKLFMAVERASQLSGFMYDTLIFYGGNGLRQYYNALVNLGELYLTAYFGALRHLGGSDPVLEFNLRSGLNDRNDTNAAIGSTALSNTQGGYEANLRALMELLRTRAIQGGWAKDQIYFRLRPSHVADATDATQAGFRLAALNVARDSERTIFINDATLLPYGEISAYYQSGGADANHLLQAGHLLEATEAHESFMRAANNAAMELEDEFAGAIPGIDSPPAQWEAVEPDDHYDIVATRCLWIGQAGDVVVLPVGENATAVKFESCPAGMLLPGRFRRILETDTTATAILAGR
jgi:hypothetical protein